MPNDAQPVPVASESPEPVLAISREPDAQPEPDALAAVDPLGSDSPLSRLPLQLDVMVPVPSFRVGDLLALEKGRVLETAWADADDIPVMGGGIQLVWSEFEVVDQRLAVRVTRLV